MRILIRTSKLAIWARRFGSLAIPLAVVPVLMHRLEMIGSDDFLILEAIAAGAAVLGLVLSLAAFVRLWITGDHGWGKASMGLFFALVCLLPFGFGVWLAVRSPAIGDVATDTRNPPPLLSWRVLPDDDELAAIAAAFPNARTRTYPVAPEQMLVLVGQLIDQRGWEAESPLSLPVVDAIAMTLLGWQDAVAVRISPDPQGAAVDMRSAALHGWSDLGENGRRVEEFLGALDQRITLLLRDMPVAPATPADAETEAAPVESEAGQ